MRYHIDIIKQEIIDEETITFDEKLLLEIREDLAQLPDQAQKIITRVFMQDMSRRRSPHLDQHRQNLVTQRDQTPAFPLLSTPRTLNFLSPKSDTIKRLSVLSRFIY